MKSQMVMKQLILLFLFFCSNAAASSSHNLVFKGEKSLTVDGQNYDVKIWEYDPPYFHTKPYKTRQEADLSMPEGTDRAIESSAGRDVDWFWSLYDLNSLEQTRPFYKTKNWSSARPLVEDLRTRISFYQQFLYKLEFEKSGKQYAVLVAQVIENGKISDQLQANTFVKQGDSWLVTADILRDPLVNLASKYDLQTFLKVIEQKNPEAAMMPKAEVTVTSAQRSYRFGDPMIFKVTLKNSGLSPFSVYWSDELGESCRISLNKRGKDESAIFYSKTGSTAKSDGYKTLAPGQEIFAEYRVENYKRSPGEGISMEESEDETFRTLIPTGEFEVTAWYNPNFEAISSPDAPNDMFMIPIASAPIYITLEDAMPAQIPTEHEGTQ